MKKFVIAVAIACVATVALFNVVHKPLDPIPEIHDVQISDSAIKMIEDSWEACANDDRYLVAATSFDTSAIDRWCDDDIADTVRMVGGWVVADENGYLTIEDETGELWNAADLDITTNDFLLLWLSDNTTEQVEDDYIVKIWSEVHG